MNPVLIYEAPKPKQQLRNLFKNLYENHLKNKPNNKCY